MGAKERKYRRTIRDICNESQMERVTCAAEKAGCVVEWELFGTVARVRGTQMEMLRFIAAYNS